MTVTRLLAFFSLAGLASATSVTFTFDAQTVNGTAINGLSSGATSAQIQTYMQSVVTAAGCAGCTVTVLVNGTAIGAVADQTYNGEKNVTGPTTSKSLTLGDSNGATASNTNSTTGSYDTFISNTNDNSGTVSNQITLQFKGFSGLSVNSFDYEIFPDGTCTSLSSANCGGAKLSNGTYPNQPDLEFQAGTGNTGSDPLVSSFGGNVGTGTAGIAYGVTPGTTNGNSKNAPLPTTSEAAPQLIGTWSAGLTGATELDFVDWPATIGIDNLNISWTPGSSVPEPVSVILLGTAVAGLALRKRLRRKTA